MVIPYAIPYGSPGSHIVLPDMGTAPGKILCLLPYHPAMVSPMGIPMVLPHNTLLAASHGNSFIPCGPPHGIPYQTCGEQGGYCLTVPALLPRHGTPYCPPSSSLRYPTMVSQ